MPIYEYECQTCRKVHEVTQKFSDAPLSACPECGAPVRKLMSLGGFALKGTGYYSTDYKRSSASSKATESAAAAPACAPGGCGKAECAS